MADEITGSVTKSSPVAPGLAGKPTPFGGTYGNPWAVSARPRQAEDEWTYAQGLDQKTTQYLNARARLEAAGIDPDTVDGRERQPWWAKGLKTLGDLGVALDYIFLSAPIRMLLGGVTSAAQGKGFFEGAWQEGAETDPFAEDLGGHAPTGKELLLMWGMGRENDRQGKIDVIDVLGLALEVAASPDVWLSAGTSPFVKAALKGGTSAMRQTADDILRASASALADSADNIIASAAPEAGSRVGGLLAVVAEEIPFGELSDVAQRAAVVRKFAALDELEHLGVVIDGAVRKEIELARAGLLPSLTGTVDDISDIAKIMGYSADDLADDAIRAQVKQRIKAAETVTQELYETNAAFRELQRRTMERLGDPGGIKIGLQAIPGFTNKPQFSKSIITQRQIDAFLAKSVHGETLQRVFRDSLPGRALMRTFVADYRIRQIERTDPLLANRLRDLKALTRGHMDYELKVGLDGLIESLKGLGGPEGRKFVMEGLEAGGEILTHRRLIVDDLPLSRIRSMAAALDKSVDPFDAVTDALDDPAAVRTLVKALPAEEGEALTRALAEFAESEPFTIQRGLADRLDEMDAIAKRYAKRDAVRRLEAAHGRSLSRTDLKRYLPDGSRNPLRDELDALLRTSDVDGHELAVMAGDEQYLTVMRDLLEQKGRLQQFEVSTLRGQARLDLTEVTEAGLARALRSFTDTLAGMSTVEKAELVIAKAQQVSLLRARYGEAVTALGDVASTATSVLDDPQYVRAAVVAQQVEGLVRQVKTELDASVMELLEVLRTPELPGDPPLARVLADAAQFFRETAERHRLALAGLDPEDARRSVSALTKPFGYGSERHLVDGLSLSRQGASPEAVSYALRRDALVDAAEIMFPDGKTPTGLTVDEMRRWIDSNPESKLNTIEALTWNGASSYKAPLYRAIRGADVGTVTGFITADIDEALGIPLVRLATSPVGLATDEAQTIIRVAVAVRKPLVVRSSDLAELGGPFTARLSIPEHSAKIRLVDLPDFGYDALHIIDDAGKVEVGLLPDTPLFHSMMTSEYAKRGPRFKWPHGADDTTRALSERPIIVQIEGGGQKIFSGAEAAALRGRAKSPASKALRDRLIEAVPELKGKRFTVADADGFVQSARVMNFDPASPARYDAAFDVVFRELEDPARQAPILLTGKAPRGNNIAGFYRRGEWILGTEGLDDHDAIMSATGLYGKSSPVDDLMEWRPGRPADKAVADGWLTVRTLEDPRSGAVTAYIAGNGTKQDIARITADLYESGVIGVDSKIVVTSSAADSELQDAVVQAHEVMANRGRELVYGRNVFAATENPVRMQFETPSAEEFQRRLSEVPESFGLTPYSAEELATMERFLDRTTGVGFALKPSGYGGDDAWEIVAVFRSGESQYSGAGSHGMVMGIKRLLDRGADVYLDCFDATTVGKDHGLVQYYERFGFRRTGEIYEWNPEYAPNDLLRKRYPNPGDGPSVVVMRLDRAAWDDFLRRNPKAISGGRIEGVEYTRRYVPTTELDDAAKLSADELLADTIARRREDQALYARYLDGDFDAMSKDFGFAAGMKDFSELSDAQQRAVRAMWLGEAPHGAVVGLDAAEAAEAVEFGQVLLAFRDEAGLRQSTRMLEAVEEPASVSALGSAMSSAQEFADNAIREASDFLRAPEIAKQEMLWYEFVSRLDDGTMTVKQRRAAASLAAQLEYYADELKRRGIAVEDLFEGFQERRAVHVVKIAGEEVAIGPALGQDAVDQINAILDQPGRWARYSELAEHFGIERTAFADFVERLREVSIKIDQMEWPKALTKAQRDQRTREIIGAAVGIDPKRWDEIDPDLWRLPVQQYVPHVGTGDDRNPFIKRLLGMIENPDDPIRRGYAGGRISEKMPNVDNARKLQGTIAAINRAYGYEKFYEDPAKAMSVYIQRAVHAVNAHDFFAELRRMQTMTGESVVLPATWVRHGDEAGAWVAREGYEIFTIPELRLKASSVSAEIAETLGDNGLIGLRESGHVAYQAPKEVVRDIESSLRAFFSDEQMLEYAKLFDKIQGIWKGYATVLRPGFHIRNAMTNLWQNMMAGVVDPRRYKQAAEIQWAGMKIHEEIVRNLVESGIVLSPEAAMDNLVASGVLKARSYTLSGRSYSTARLYSMMRERNVLGTGRIGSDIHLFTEQELARLNPLRGGLNPASQAFYPTQVGRQVGELIENNARAAHFLEMLDLTGDPAASMWSVKRYLFDYSELTDIERHAFKRIMPFYAWLRKNIGLQAELMVTRPGMTAETVRAMNWLDDNAELENRPEWAEEMGAFAVPGLTLGKVNSLLNKITPLDLPEDDETPLMMSLGLPFLDLTNLNERDLFGAASPFVKMPIEKITNYNVFFGRPIQLYDGELKPAPASLEVVNSAVQTHASEKQKAAWAAAMTAFGAGVVDGELKVSPWFDYFWRQFGPHVEAYGKAIKSDDERQAGYLIALLTGVKFVPVDEEREAYYDMSERAQALQDYIRSLEDRGAEVPRLRR